MPTFPLRQFIVGESGLGFLDESLPQRQMGGVLIEQGNLRDHHAGDNLWETIKNILAE